MFHKQVVVIKVIIVRGCVRLVKAYFSILIIFLSLGTFECTPYEFVAHKGKSAKTDSIKSQSIAKDTSLSKIPLHHNKKYESQHGIILGCVGSITGVSLMLHMNLQAETLNYETLVIGGSVGFFCGYLIGRYSGRSYAKKKHKLGKENN